MMKQHITKEQIMQLSPEAQTTLRDWWLSTIEYDDHLVHVYIVEEDTIYDGEWDREYPFSYDEEYIGKLKNHRGTMLPLLSIGELIAFLDEHKDNKLSYDSYTEMYGPYDGGFICKDLGRWTVSSTAALELCDALFEVVKDALNLV